MYSCTYYTCTETSIDHTCTCRCIIYAAHNYYGNFPEFEPTSKDTQGVDYAKTKKSENLRAAR